ncbi:MAG: EscU/YscU/HrcU family type III secretion system export apparatus switch protein, partial [Oligoflexia bacterium]|nr:EscU/YscU/HrcU family type III secretion system export apparatus switch protein [Oligoflexia bacterium]
FEWAYNVDVNSIFSDHERFKIVLYKSITTIFQATLPMFLASISVGIITSVMQSGFIFAPDVLSFDLNRINPLNGIKRLISLKLLFDTLKSILKLVIVVVITYMVVKNELYNFGGTLHVELLQSFLFGKTLFVKISFSILLGLLVIAIGDFAWEKYRYRKRLLLTKQESKQEFKEREGNPEIKQRIRTVQREISRKRMMAKVPTADAIISNPTHISVAIKYHVESMVAPVVIAKGADFLALKIREIAKIHNIPIIENIQLARTLYQTVKVGESIPRNLYKAVAEILAYVYRRKKRK